MSQVTGQTLSVTNGSPIITDASATFVTDGVLAGNGLTVVDSGVTYDVATIDSETQITLSANYAGATATNVSYAIFTDFTSPDSIPEIAKGDIETATIVTRSIRKIQDLFTQFKTLIATTTTHNFTSDGDYTLTSTQENYGKLRLTDTTPVLTVARNVIVSTTTRGRWYTNNSLQTITIKTSAGTGVAILAGGSLYCICDGTNVVAGSNLLGLGTTASGVELSFNDGAVAGIAIDSTTVVLDSNKDVAGLRYVSADMFIPTSPFSFRNKIINGNFDFWDYATSQTSSGYGSDNRWVNANTGTTKVHSRQAFTLGQTDVPGNPKYYSRTVVTSVAGAGNYCAKTQRIEGVNTFAGQFVTVSFYAKADSTKNISIERHQHFGTGGTPSADKPGSSDILGFSKITLTSSWQKYTVNLYIPSISGETLGTNGNDFLQVLFWFDAGSDYNARTNSLGQQSGTFDIAQVQFEEGAVATPFEQRPLAIERELCQRYYEIIGFIVNATSPAFTSYSYGTRKRVTPTLTYISGGSISPATLNTRGSTSNFSVDGVATAAVFVTYSASAEL